MRAEVEPLPDTADTGVESEAYERRIRELAERAVTLADRRVGRRAPAGAGHRGPAAPRLSARLDARRLAEGEAGDPRRRSAGARSSRWCTALLAREVSVLELKGKIESQAQAEMSESQRQYYLRQQLKAIQEQLGEGEASEVTELREKLEDAALPEPVQTAVIREIDRLARMSGTGSGESQMIRTYIDWVLEVPWTVTTDGPHRSGRGARGARRGPLRPRQGQGAHRRVPGGPQAQGRHEGADPVLRRPARRRQDLARPVDRPGDGAQVRAHLARRRPRRGRDPRPSPHLHRRAARPHRPGAEAGRLDEPGLHARRARQAGGRASRAIRRRRCSRCSTRRRTTPSATTTSRCRSTSRRCCSSPPPTTSGRCTRRCSIGWRSSRSRATPRRTRSTSPAPS